MNGTAQGCHEHPCPGSDPRDGGKTAEQPGRKKERDGQASIQKNNFNVIIMHFTACETLAKQHVRNSEHENGV